MKAGEVVRQRLSPADAMAVVDIIELMGLNPVGLSISGAASIAMSAAFEELRIAGKIPYRKGYEFESMMQVFTNRNNTKNKRAMTEQLYLNAAHGVAPSLSGMNSQIRDISDVEQQIKLLWKKPEEYNSWPPEKMIAWQVEQQDKEDALRNASK